MRSAKTLARPLLASVAVAVLIVTAQPAGASPTGDFHPEVTAPPGAEAAGDPAENPGSPICYLGGSVVSCLGDNGGTWNGSCWEVVWADSPDTAIWEPGQAGGAPGWNDVNARSGDVIDLWKSLAPDGRATTTGAIVQCLTPDGQYTYFWRQSAEPPPSVEELTAAVRLRVEGQITAPGIGVFPGQLDGTDPTITGFIGWPAWFWAEDPGPGVGAPWTIEDTVRGYTLRATARLVDIVYDTGDKHTVTCGLGAQPTGPNRHHPASPPPKCGWTYQERGHYTITATTHVAVDWSGAGRSGTIPITVDRSGGYDVAEIQVLIVPGNEKP